MDTGRGWMAAVVATVLVATTTVATIPAAAAPAPLRPATAPARPGDVDAALAELEERLAAELPGVRTDLTAAPPAAAPAPPQVVTSPPAAAPVEAAVPVGPARRFDRGLDRVASAAPLSAAPLSAVPLADEVGPCTHTWNGLAGDGLWQSSGNWSPDDVPGATTVACVSGVAVQVAPGATRTVGGLRVTGGGSLTVPAGARLDVEGPAEVERLVVAGTLGGAGTVTVGAEPLVVEQVDDEDGGGEALLWTAGTLTGTGTLVVRQGTDAVIAGAATKTLDRPVQNQGLLDWREGRIFVGAGGGVTNEGLLAIEAAASLDDGGGAPEPVVTSTGAVLVSTTGTTTLSGVALRATGIVDVASGSRLVLAGAHESALDGLSVGGTLRVEGGATTLTGPTETAALEVVGGTVTVDAALPGETATVTRATVSGGELVVDREQIDVYLTDLALSGGTVSGSADLTVLSSMTWSAGALAGPGGFTVAPDATVEIVGGATKTLDRPLLNLSWVQWDGGRIFVGPGGAVDNRSLIVMNAAASMDDGGAAVEPVLTSSGGIVVGGTGTTTVSGVAVQATGLTSVDTDARLDLAGAGSEASSFATLAGPGTVRVSSGEASFAGTTEVAALEVTGGTATIGTAAAGTDADVARVAVSGGRLDVERDEGDVTLATVAVSGGTLGGETDVEVTELSWSGGTLAGPGSLTLAGDGAGEIVGGATKTLDRPLVNLGWLRWEAGRIFVGSGGGIDNRSLLEMLAAASLDDGGAVGEQVLTSSGGLSVDGTGTTTVSGVAVQATGLTVVDTDARLDLAGAGSEASSFATLGGGGAVRVSAGVVALAGTTEVGSLEVAAGTATVEDAAADVDLDVASVVVSGGELVIDRDEPEVDLHAVTVSGGTLSGPTDLVVPALTFTAGRLAGSGRLTIPQDGEATWSGGPTKELDRPYASDGATTWSGGRVFVDGGGGITSAGPFAVTGAVTLDDGGGAHAPVLAITGTLSLAADAALDVTGVGVANDGTLVLAPGAVLEVGTFTQGPIGETDVHVAGPGPTQHGQVVVEGTATLAGALTVTTVPPFVPGSEPVTVVDATTRSGTFATFAGAGWAVSYEGDDVVIGPPTTSGPPTVVVLPTSAPESADAVLVTVQGVGGDVPITLPAVAIARTAGIPADLPPFVTAVTVVPGGTATVSVPLVDDALDEDDETFLLDVAGSSAIVTIVDDDAPPVVRIDEDPLVVEGDSGTRDLVFTVRLTDVLGDPAPSGRNVAVFASTTGGTAVAGEDYDDTSTLVAVPAGQSTATVAVPVIGDEVDEDEETVVVTLASPTAATLDDDRSATGTIIDDDGAVADHVAAELRDGAPLVATAVPGWGSAFDLGGFDLPARGLAPFDLPVVTDDLATALGTGDALGAGAVAAPLAAVDGALAEVVADLRAAGVTIDWAAGGVGGTPTPPTGDDVLQARYQVTLADLAGASGFEPDATVLEDLAAALDLDADLDLTADLVVTIVFGVDVDGFYLGDGSGLRLDVGATGTIDGTADAGGVDGLAVSGTGEADLAVTLRPTGGPERLRADDLDDDPFTLLRPAAEGTAELDLDLTVDQLALTWAADVEVTTDDGGDVAVATSASVDGTLDLPGFRLGTSPAATPARIAFTGTSTDDGWALEGAATVAADLEADGFAVRSLTGSALVGPDTADVEAALDLEVAGGDEPTRVTAGLTVADDGWEGTATVAREVLRVGPVRIDEPSITVTAAHVTATGATTIGVAVTADRGRVDGPEGPDGPPLVEVTGLDGSLDRDGRVCVGAETVAGTVGGGLAFETDVAATDVEVCSPGGDGVLVRAGEVVATLAELDDLEVTVTGLVLDEQGRFGAGSVSVEQPDGIARAIGLAGLVPVDLTSLELTFPDHADGDPVPDLSTFELALVGTVDLDDDAFAGLPFTPLVGLGGEVFTPETPADERVIRFSALVEDVDPLVVRPLDLGPVTLGFEDLRLGDYRLAGSLTADGYVDGVLQPRVCGSAEVTGGFDTFDAGAAVEVCGSITETDGGPVVDLEATITGSLAVRDGVEIEDLALTFAVSARFVDGAVVVGGSLESSSLGRVTIPFGEHATLQVTEVDLDLSPLPGDPVLTVGGSLDEEGSGASLVFGPALDALSGWGGRVGRVGLTDDFVPVALDGFFAQVEVPDGERFGLPDFLPLFVDDVGFSLPELSDDGDVDPGTELTPEVLEGLRVRFSGGLAGTPTFPISASVEGLEVDLGRLLAFDPLAPIDLDTFPITNLDGVGFGIEPALDLGGVEVSGSLIFGAVDVGSTSVLYGRIRGDVSTPAFQAGADIVISQAGPVLLRVTAPVGVPLGPTGFVLRSVTGAAEFGPDAVVGTPREGHPEDLMTELFDLPTDVEVDRAAIERAVAPTVPPPGGTPTYTWDHGFAIALEGNLSHIASAGMVEGRVTLAAAFGSGVGQPGGGVKLVGRGAISAFGIPLSEGLEVGGDLAVGGLMLDFTDALNPSMDLAFESPVDGSPLALVFPAQAQVSAQLRTDGVVEGIGAGLEAFVTGAVDGGLEVGGDLFAAAVDDLAADLQARRTSPLARLVLPPEDPGVITADLVQGRLAVLLSDPATAGPVAGPLLGALATSIADRVATGDFGLTVAEAAAALYDVVGDAAVDALRAAGARFDPSFTFTGALQPLLLGIPVGDPSTSVTVAVDRTSLRFEATVSMIETLKAAGRQLPGVGVFAEQAINLATLGGRDSLTFGVQVPMPGLTDVLLLGDDLPTLDPADAGQGWSITVGGSYELHGLRAEVSGFLTAPDNAAFVDSKVEQRYEPTETPPDPDRVQITRPEDYANLIRHGGLVLDGRLEVPRLLTDPVDVLGDLPPIPEDTAGIVKWLADGAEAIGRTETPVRLTAFVPGMGEVLDDPTEATVREWADAIVVSGVFEGTPAAPGQPPVAKLLSVPIGEGRLLATTAGVEVTAEVPLLGLDGTFVLRVDERDGTLVPAGGLELDLSAAEAQAALRDLGLPAAFTVDAEAHVRAFTPGFDPSSEDPLRQRGGLAVGATLDAPGFVTDAAFEVVVDPVGTGFGPDLVAHAEVAKIGPFAGNEVRDAVVDVRKVGKTVTVHVEGDATLAGTEVHVRGDLRPDLTGTLTVTSGPTPTIGGLRFTQGGFSLTLARSSGQLVGSVGLSGTVELPAFMAARSATATATAAGCLGTDGALEIRLGLSGLRLDPAGATRITGTGAALPIDPGAPCTLPPGTPALPTSSARLVVRTVGGVTRVVVDGAVVIDGSGLPLLTVTGSLATDGTGSLTVGFGTDGLSLSGLVVRGTATLRLLSGGRFDLTVDGRLSVPGVVSNAVVSGQITSAGIQRLSVAVTGLDLSPVVVRTATLDIVKVGTAHRLDAALTVEVSGVRTTGSTAASITVRGSIASNGDFSLRADGSGFTVAGVGLTSAALSVTKTGSTFAVAANARFSLWSTALEVEGSITIRANGLAGRFRLSLPNDANGTEPALKVGGWGLGGTFELAFAVSGSPATTSATVSLTNGTATIPGVGTFAASATMATNGTGSITVSAPDGIRLGGATSPFLATGTFGLRLSAGVVTFTATGASLRYQPVGGTEAFRVSVPDLRIASDGSFGFTTQGATIGSADGLRLVIPSAELDADPLGLDLTFRMGAGQLFVPELATGSTSRPALTTPAITVTTGPFRYTLFDAKMLDLGLLRLNGKLVFERTTAGVFRLAIEGTSTGPAHVDLGELGRVDLPSFFIASNGDFSVTATTTRLGVGGVEILDASISFQRAATLVFVGVTGGKLRLPALSQPIELPNLLIRGGTSFTKPITLPRIDLGPFFRTDEADFTLRVTRDEVSFELDDEAGNDPSVTAFAGSASMTLNAFRVTSNGDFTGSVTGRLALFERQISNATFDVRLASGVLELRMTSSGETLNLGFATMSMSGYARSDGSFSFTGTASTDGSLLGVTWNGSVSITLSSSSGITGSYSGRVSVGAISASATGSMSSTGHVEGTVGIDLNGDGSRGGFSICGPLGCTRVAETVSYEFDMDPTPLSEDTTDPSMAQPPNLSIATSQATGTIPVFYAQPTATDTRDGPLNPRCTPGSGTDFTIGRATTVTCTARDAAGNSRTRTFTITVTFVAGTVSLFGTVVQAALGGFGSGTTSAAFVFTNGGPDLSAATRMTARAPASRADDPRHLADAVAGADGKVHYRIEMPDGMEPGPGHIVVAGTDPAAAQRLWIVPITVGPDGRIASLRADAAPPVVTPDPPSGPGPGGPSGGGPAGVGPGGSPVGSSGSPGLGSGLARTGTDLALPVRLALLVLLLGAALLLSARHARRRPHPNR